MQSLNGIVLAAADEGPGPDQGQRDHDREEEGTRRRKGSRGAVQALRKKKSQNGSVQDLLQ